MAVLAEKIDDALDTDERQHVNPSWPRLIGSVEDSRLDPRTNSWLRQPEHSRCVRDLHAPVAAGEVVTHQLKPSPSVGIGLRYGEILESEQIVDDLCERHAEKSIRPLSKIA